MHDAKAHLLEQQRLLSLARHRGATEILEAKAKAEPRCSGGRREGTTLPARQFVPKNSAARRKKKHERAHRTKPRSCARCRRESCTSADRFGSSAAWTSTCIKPRQLIATYREAPATVAGDDDDLHNIMAAARAIDGECTHLLSSGDDDDDSDGEGGDGGDGGDGDDGLDGATAGDDDDAGMGAEEHDGDDAAAAAGDARGRQRNAHGKSQDDTDIAGGGAARRERAAHPPR